MLAAVGRTSPQSLYRRFFSAVVDQYQGQGIGGALMRHLAVIGRQAGLQELTAEVLPENLPMLKVFEKSGLQMSTKQDSGTVHVTPWLV